MSAFLSRRSFLRDTGTLLTASALSQRAFGRQPGAGKHAVPTPHALQTPYKLNRLVLEKSPIAGDFDDKFVDCPFVFHHEGGFRMTYIGFDGKGYQTGLATSPDLVNWSRVACILRRQPDSPVFRYNIAMMWIVRENNAMGAGNLKKIHGRYLGAWHAYPNPGMEAGPAVIGLCWSDDLIHWELEQPCLRPDDPDATAWERGGLYKPCLVESDGTFYLFYNAKTVDLPRSEGGGWHEQTGLATSNDLRHWTRSPLNPVIANGPAGSWDDRFASDPCAVLWKNQWAVFYYGLSSRDGKARDLLALGRQPDHLHKTDSILVDAGPPGSIDDDYAHKPSVIAWNGDFYHFYTAVSGKYPNDIRGISVARSRPWA
ncbi:MAG: hypothetical protein HIU93_01835 [Acidobacteria bacterium]|nr:hypothetical protein [Acidobacteriota bacterium]MBW4043961.1 hypothetical protein [Acidobacteriota bacterium]